MPENNKTPYDLMIEGMTFEELKHWAKVGLITTTHLFAKAINAARTMLSNKEEANGK